MKYKVGDVFVNKVGKTIHIRITSIIDDWYFKVEQIDNGTLYYLNEEHFDEHETLCPGYDTELYKALNE